MVTIVAAFVLGAGTIAQGFVTMYGPVRTITVGAPVLALLVVLTAVAP